jgi:hypothetical protein
MAQPDPQAARQAHQHVAMMSREPGCSRSKDYQSFWKKITSYVQLV